MGFREGTKGPREAYDGTNRSGKPLADSVHWVAIVRDQDGCGAGDLPRNSPSRGRDPEDTCKTKLANLAGVPSFVGIGILGLDVLVRARLSAALAHLAPHSGPAAWEAQPSDFLPGGDRDRDSREIAPDRPQVTARQAALAGGSKGAGADGSATQVVHRS